MNSQILAEFTKIFTEDNISISIADRITHSYDATQNTHLPDVIIYASNSNEISQVVQIANKHKIPVIPRGAGSGFSGGTVPVCGGIVLVLTTMDKILEIDTDNLTATVEPGVITGELQRQVEKVGLFYPPDPASKEFSTLGGNVAECAGGPRCVKYGVTKDYILGLEIVTPTGDIITTGGKTLKNVVGYDLTKLLVGSEGTLGIITKIILKLLPKPTAKHTILVQFTSIEGAAQSVSAIIKGKIIPTALEFMDSTTIDCIRSVSPTPIDDKCKAILIIEVDGEPETLERQTKRIQKIIEEYGIVSTHLADSEEESEKIWQVRRIVSPTMRKINPDKFNEDIVVPRSMIPDMIRILEQISNNYDIPIVNFGHAGDGNIHVNIMVDLNEDGVGEKVENALDDIFRETINLGGSISGEHGIGISKAKYLGLELSKESLAYMKLIKKAFDPNNILNPGKIFE